MQTRQHDLGDIDVNPAISAAQCRAARALLELSRADLAKAAAVGERTVADFESKSRTPIRATLAAIQRALEAAGVEFLPDNGVKLKAAAKSSTASPAGGSGGSEKPSGQSVHTDQDAERGALKPARRKKPPAADRKAKPAAAPRSKLDQIRALREQGAR